MRSEPAYVSGNGKLQRTRSILDKFDLVRSMAHTATQKLSLLKVDSVAYARTSTTS